MINKYPYTDFNEYNMDWIIKTVKDLTVEWASTKEEWGTIEQEWTDLKNYIDNFFQNLDLQDEVNNKINAMINSGYFSDLFQQLFSSSVLTQSAQQLGDWINANLMQETGYVIDSSLSVPNAAADAAATGVLKSLIKDLNEYEICRIYANFVDEIDNRGTQITWNGNTATCVQSGTTTGTGIGTCFLGAAVYNAGIPEPFVAGHRYAIEVKATDSHLRVQFLNWKPDGTFDYVSLNDNGTAVITANASAIGFRLNISAGYSGTHTLTVNIYEQADIKQIHGMTSDRATAEYSNKLENLPVNSYTWFSTSWFTDVPGPLDPNENAGVIFTLSRDIVKNGNNQIHQIVFFPILGEAFIRRKNGNDPALDWTALQGYFKSDPKMFAFGDSLMWGSVWTVDPLDPDQAVISQTAYKNRMASHIAHAVGADYNFLNKAVGGMAFIPHAGSYATSFYDYITAQDLTGAELIVLSGGRNDAPNTLGSGETPVNGTICYEIKKILDYLTTTYPKAQIVFVQVTPSTSVNANVFVGVTAGGWSLNSWKTEVSKLCKKYGVPFVDWEECQYIYHWGDFTGAGGNTAHPNNDEAYKQMGNYLAGKISSYYKG